MTPRRLRFVAALSAVLGLAGASTAAAAAPTPAAPRCTTAQLRVSLGPAPGGLSHSAVAIVFRNHGGRCSLEGYPGVAGLSVSGATVFNARRSLNGYLGGARRIAPVTLRPRTAASALLEWIDVAGPGQSCHRTGALAITPPGDRPSVRRDTTGRLCGPILIHPVVAGRNAGDGV